jgi:hypothetical protein
MGQHVISEAEMQHATDATAPADPGKFLPYRKLVATLFTAQTAFDSRREELMRLRTLLIVISEGTERSPELLPDLARIAEDMSDGLKYADTIVLASDALKGLPSQRKAARPQRRSMRRCSNR